MTERAACARGGEWCAGRSEVRPANTRPVWFAACRSVDCSQIASNASGINLERIPLYIDASNVREREEKGGGRPTCCRAFPSAYSLPSRKFGRAPSFVPPHWDSSVFSPSPPSPHPFQLRSARGSGRPPLELLLKLNKSWSGGAAEIEMAREGVQIAD